MLRCPVYRSGCEHPLSKTPKAIGLCCGSLLQADFRTLAEAAARAGFSTISLWPTLFYGARDSGLSDQDMRNILADNGLQVTELDPLASWLTYEGPGDSIGGELLDFREDDFFRIADTLGARSLNIIQQGESAASWEEKVELIGRLNERAAGRDLLLSVEFLPWSAIGSLGQALSLVEAVGDRNFGVNIDTWHHFRSGGTITELLALDPGTVTALQFNDVAAEPWDNLLEETAMGRLLPGHGVSDSVAVYRALREAGVTAPLSVEVFAAELMALPAAEAARRLADSTRDVIARA